MESIIFDYIGYVLVFCAALCVVAPLLVCVVSLAVGVIWKIIDEGDSESPDLLKKVMPSALWNGVDEIDGKYAVYKSCGDYYAREGDNTWCIKQYILEYCAFELRKDAEALAIKLGAGSYRITETLLVGLLFLCLGAGFIVIPTITMYALSSALCLLSLRWSRRGYKKVKKLKVALDEHAKNKEAHK